MPFYYDPPVIVKLSRSYLRKSPWQWAGIMVYSLHLPPQKPLRKPGRLQRLLCKYRICN